MWGWLLFPPLLSLAPFLTLSGPGLGRVARASLPVLQPPKFPCTLGDVLGGASWGRDDASQEEGKDAVLSGKA